MRSCDVVRDGGAPDRGREDGLWAVAIANALLSAAAERRVTCDPEPIGSHRGGERGMRPRIVERPSATGPSLLGGSISLPAASCST